MIGIYKITNPNNKVYIGQSIDIEKRFRDYIGLKSKSQLLLHRSFLKYGIDIHTFEIIEECDRESLNNRERYWQDYYNCINPEKGLNLKLTNADDKPSILSQESRDKLSKSSLGKTISITQRDKTSKALIEFYKTNTHPAKDNKRGTINNILNKEQVLEIRQLILDQKTTVEIAELFNISNSTVQQIKQGKTWQSLGEFKVEGKASRLKKEDLQTLYNLFEQKTSVKEIQKIVPYCIAIIAKQRKIWKQIKELDQ